VTVPQIFALQEDLLVGDDAIVLETCQDAHLIERILNFLLRKVRQFHFLQRVYPAVCATLHAKHLTVCSLASVNQRVPSFGPI